FRSQVRGTRRERQDGDQPLPSLSPVAALVPDPVQRFAQTQRHFHFTPGERPVQRAPEVIVLLLQGVQTLRPFYRRQVTIGPFRHRDVIVRVPSSQLRQFFRGQLLRREFPERLQQAETGLGVGGWGLGDG